MKEAIVYNSVTGNAKELAEAIKEVRGDVYCGKPEDSTLDSDLLFVGFWTKGGSCDDATAEYLKKLKGKKVFLFGSAGYNDSSEFFQGILEAAKNNLDGSNEVVGQFACMGKVSPQKQANLKELGKFDGMKDKLALGESHPDGNDLENLKKLVKTL